MPTLFKCFALRVTMNPRGNEYNPPHVHAYYKDDMAVVDVKTLSVLTIFCKKTYYVYGE